jgi:hypothetical protein
MSSIVRTNDNSVFGPQSPFFRVITDSGLKETLLHLLVDKNSKVIRRRSFLTYLFINKIFPSNTLAINEGIRFGITQFLTPFLRLSVKNSIDSLLNLKPSSYIQSEIALTNELSKVLKIKSILAMVVNDEKTSLYNHKGITTYITRKLEYCEDNTLDVTWTNGFFTFNDLDTLSILIVIPKQYIANMIMNVSTLDLGSGGTTFTDNMVFLEALRNEMIIDMIKSFLAAIYSDGYRHRIHTDIITLNNIFQNEGANIASSADDEETVYNSILSKYKQKLRGFKADDCENLVYECMKFFQYQSHVTINPYEFYKAFIDIPYSHIQQVFKRIPSLNLLSNKSIQSQIAEPDFSNNLFKMNIFFDDERSVIIYGLKLIRYLPYFLFNTYVIGGGNYHSQMLQVLNNAGSFIAHLNSFKNSNIIYGPLTSYIVEELDYLVNVFAKEMESPLKVNDKSRHMVVNLISNSLRVANDSVL